MLPLQQQPSPSLPTNSNSSNSSSSSGSSGVSANAGGSYAVPVLVNQNVLYVHEVQRGNPVLNHIKNVKWSFTTEIKSDYLMGTTAALFLSVKYHHRHPKVSKVSFPSSSSLNNTHITKILASLSIIAYYTSNE
jgi:DNA repair protein Rad10